MALTEMKFNDINGNEYDIYIVVDYNTHIDPYTFEYTNINNEAPLFKIVIDSLNKKFHKEVVNVPETILDETIDKIISKVNDPSNKSCVLLKSDNVYSNTFLRKNTLEHDKKSSLVEKITKEKIHRTKIKDLLDTKRKESKPYHGQNIDILNPENETLTDTENYVSTIDTKKENESKKDLQDKNDELNLTLDLEINEESLNFDNNCNFDSCEEKLSSELDEYIKKLNNF